MGMIAIITPGVQSSGRRVPKVVATSDDLIKIGKVNIQFYNTGNSTFDSLKYQDLYEVPDVSDPTRSLEVLAKMARPLNVKGPSWSGFMQTVQSGSYPGKSYVLFLPMIDLNPSDMTCIYSTLWYVVTQAKRLRVAPILTFDQPLYWKALKIVINEPENSDLKSVVLRLGAFHTQMSFLGCIGYLMQNTGLHELLDNVYAPNSVTQMLCGKSVSRAVRAHILVEDALNTLLLEKALPSLVKHSNCNANSAEHGNHLTESDHEVDADQDMEADQDLVIVKDLKELLENVYTKDVQVDVIIENEALKKIHTIYTSLREIRSCYRTAKLWFLYLDMISLLKTFIKAERTGNWELHLKTMKDMLPYFAAAGHHLYLKSGYIYLQQMASLRLSHPDVHQLFMNGQHVVRRNERFWAGLPTDLVIEQILMRSVRVREV